MKTLILSTFATLALTAGTAMAGVVKVDFDDKFLPTGVFAPGTSFNGLTFNESIQVGDNFGAPSADMTDNYARMFVPPFGATAGGSVSGAFSGDTVSMLTFLVGDSGSDTDVFQLTGLDINGNIVADSGLISSAAATTVGITGSGISSFSLFISDDTPADGGSSVFDNIMFEVEMAPVPLPATLPLVGFGLAALGLTARRRKA